VKDLLDKLSPYNLFNYLLPGVILAILVDEFTTIKLLRIDIVTGVFFYCFLGSVVSRIGSLIVEPILLGFRFIEYSPYADFMKASKTDAKLEVLSEQNNVYRTFISLILTVGLVWAYEKGTLVIPFLKDASSFLCILLLLLLFLFSYRKQTAYISKRVQACKSFPVNIDLEPAKECDQEKAAEGSSGP
jgi:hypothetical protein